MEILAVWTLTDIASALLAAFGLGLVIFIHELGHFAVAKWCGVKVERFSIGFGPVLLRFTKGETEYALSALPLGGYVKMLGQDDADPAQMTSEQVARDPRSYTAKTVPQRMAIISAGVINNLITAVLFFILAYSLGVHYNPAVIGAVTPGMPAWQAGLRQGDRIVRIGRHAGTQLGFADLRRAVALSHKGERIEIEVDRNGKRINTEVEPMRQEQNKYELFPSIHAEAEFALTLASPKGKDARPVNEGLSAATAQPPFEGGDRIVELNGTKIASYTEFQTKLARLRSETVTVGVRRKEEPETAPVTEIVVAPNHFRTLGLRMAMGKIRAIQPRSPAATAPEGAERLQVGDTITHVKAPGAEPLKVGQEIDVLRLPDFFASHAGEEVTIMARREVKGGSPAQVSVSLVPEDRPEWVERPDDDIDNCPLAISSLGIAVQVLHHVVAVEPGSPAAEAEIREGDDIVELTILPLADSKASDPKAPPTPSKPITISFADQKLNWPGAFWAMQSFPRNQVELKIKSPNSPKERTAVLTPSESPDWYLPVRGIALTVNSVVKKAENIGDAVSLGFDHTLGSFTEMYLTIRGLFSRRISSRSVGGPIRIAETAFVFARLGYGDLLLFLAMLSVSLAVLNFLPIPVLDGGHFMFLAWEGIRGKPASEKVIITATWIGLAMILSLMVWVLYMDISSKFSG